VERGCHTLPTLDICLSHCRRPSAACTGLNYNSRNVFTVTDTRDSHLLVMLRTITLEPAGSPSVPPAVQEIFKFRNQSETLLYNKVATAHPNGAKRKHTAPTHTHTYTPPFCMCVCVCVCKFYSFPLFFLPFYIFSPGQYEVSGGRTGPKPLHPSVDTQNCVVRCGGRDCGGLSGPPVSSQQAHEPLKHTSYMDVAAEGFRARLGR
jgi:hypothetical protein